MKRVPLEKTALTASQLAQMAEKEPIILTRKGKPLAEVTSLNGQDWETVALNHSVKFREIIEDSMRSYWKDGGFSLEQVCQELGLEPPNTKPNRRSVKKKK